jgi:long-subunit acyl-CoA synthetase (AMP-forming)
MTEDFICSHFSLPNRSRVGYVGHPLPGVDVRISPEGEIQIKSPGCMKGYYKLPDLTKESMTPDGYFRTGDRGERDSDGRLRITGRVKELFKTSKGKYVAPVPIENLINAHTSIELSCVTGAGLPQPLAVVMLAEGLRKQFKEGKLDQSVIETELAALHQQVNAQVEEWERLACLVVVTRDEWQIENGFLTPTMKLKRSVVDDHYGPQLPAWSESRKQVVWYS